MSKRKVYWHEAFFEAMKLELHNYRGALDFVGEYPLSKEALVIDILIIKKEPGVEIQKNIGRLFRGHNVVEYKSERDSLSVYDYHKILAYALLYSSFKRVDITDITVTFALTIHPRELMRHIRGTARLSVREAGKGITYIEGGIVPVQILESGKLPEDENLFIRGLRRGNSAEQLQKILRACEEQQSLDMRNVYIDRLRKANEETFEEVLMMNNSWKKLFFKLAEETGWLKKRDEKRDEEREKAIREAAAMETAKRLLGFGLPIDKISIATKLTTEEVMKLAGETDANAFA